MACNAGKLGMFLQVWSKIAIMSLGIGGGDAAVLVPLSILMLLRECCTLILTLISDATAEPNRSVVYHTLVLLYVYCLELDRRLH